MTTVKFKNDEMILFNMNIKVINVPTKDDDMLTYKVRYQGRDIIHAEVDILHAVEDPIFGLTWTTNVPTQQGLDVIRDSYRRLKNDYQEVGKLLGVRNINGFTVGDATFEISYEKEDFFPLLVGTTLSDSEHSGSDMSSRTGAMNLEYFLNPDSLREKSPSAKNPLLWVRVETEYMTYYFQGEQKQGERECGVIDNRNGVDEIVKFYQDTAQFVIPDDHLDKLQKVLGELVNDYPQYDKKK